MRHPRGRVLIFAKAPVPGRVKTRLSSRYGSRGAARLYQCLLRRTLELACGAGLAPVELWCAPDTRHPFLAACRRDFAVPLISQPGGDLGRRMDRALAATLERRDYGLLIGGDCLLSRDDLVRALDALAAGREAVFKPAYDGGYLLVGLSRPCPALFQGIPWGSDRVMAATRRRLIRAGLDWTELPPGWDVDYPADVKRWRRGSF
ncbi:MAG: TIGR04282 family arsenosugar biosynthesis glycosyltransferase [Candidatus Competibacteraceae bacterium]|nr:TIGR04282 family arsenosugar biosynthesis glycosyltransferase [Candidatus Competibacteraceae bacterium]